MAVPHSSTPYRINKHNPSVIEDARGQHIGCILGSNEQAHVTTAFLVTAANEKAERDRAALIAEVQAFENTHALRIAEVPTTYEDGSPAEFPAHLRDNAPFVVCDSCGKKSWDLSDRSKICGFSQPDGSLCGGSFR